MHLDTPRPSLLADIPSGEAGTYATVRLMRRFVQKFKKSLTVREAALSLVDGHPQKDWFAEVNSIFTWVRDHIRYVRDIHGVETLQTPVVTLELGAGDCDDKSTLMAALLESVGYPTRFIAAGYRQRGNYSHVYVEAKVGNRWVPLDATLLEQPMGSLPPAPEVARMVIHN